MLKSKVEKLFLLLPQSLGSSEGAICLISLMFICYLPIFSRSAFVANLHLIGSLCEARRIASRATSSVMPSISNITLPGLTTATQYSGLPFRSPRVSAGFSVMGLSGEYLDPDLTASF